MRPTLSAAILGLVLAAPAAAQTPNIGQLLQGLTTGNRDQDQTLRDAFERGYQRGRQDEARLSRSEPDRGYRREDDRRPDDNRNGARDNGRGDRPYGQQPGGSTYGR